MRHTPVRRTLMRYTPGEMHARERCTLMKWMFPCGGQIGHLATRPEVYARELHAHEVHVH
jgi:hypothetical protein